MSKASDDVPEYLKDAIRKLEDGAAMAGFYRILPSEHPIFTARENLAEAIRRYAVEFRREP
jgi:hypothetical protein